MKREQALYILKLLIFFAAYYITAGYGLRFDAVSGFATLFWLPSGISLAILLLWGYRYWPGITLGAFLVNLATGAPLLVALGIAVGNTLESVVGAYLLRRFIHIDFRMNRLIDVLGLVVFAGLVGTFFSATVGVTSLLFGGIVTYATYAQTWVAWWLGDMVSNVIIVPFFLVWSTRLRLFKEPMRYFEGISWLIVVCGSWMIVFGNLLTNVLIPAPRTYWVFPPLIWAALRFGQRWTVTAIFMVTVVAVWSTVLGYGPFANERLSESLLALHIFLLVIAITSMILAAVMSEREQLEKRKDNFISIASHELKTPITSSKSYIQVLKQRFKKEKDQKALSSFTLLSKADEQLDKLTLLINDLLDVSKIQSGKFALRQKKFDIDTFVQKTVEGFQQTTTHKIKREGLVKKKMVGDEYRLAQVLTNLLTNAVKYSPNADIVIVNTVADDAEVVISVQDFGIGMSREAQKKIYEPFFQVEDVKREGLGLGLHIASEIIRGHGGTVTVESKKGKGSIFSVILPLEQTKRLRIKKPRSF